jgi:hypothetical protein
MGLALFKLTATKGSPLRRLEKRSGILAAPPGGAHGSDQQMFGAK